MAGYIGQLLMPDIAGAVMGGYQQGQDRADKQTLAKYMQGAVNGDSGALAQVYRADPSAGIQAQQIGARNAQQASALKDQEMARLGKHARMITALADAGDMQGAASLYSTIYPEAAQILGPGLPQQFEPSMLPHMKQIAQSMDPTAKTDYIKGSPGDVFVDPATGKPAFTIPGDKAPPQSIQELQYLQQHPDLLGIKTQLAAAGRAPSSDNGKSSDWVVQPDAAGNIWRVNKLTGEAQQVKSGDGAPVLNKQALAAQQQANAAQGAAASFKTALSTLDTLEKSPGLDAAVGLSSLLPTRPGSDAANFESQLESFKSQTFLPMVQNLRGMGALSDAEGSKLANAVGSLSLKQSESQFRQSIKTIRSTLQAAEKRAQDNASKVGGITGRNAQPSQAQNPRATNPQTGETVEFVNGQWVPVNG